MYFVSLRSFPICLRLHNLQKVVKQRLKSEVKYRVLKHNRMQSSCLLRSKETCSSFSVCHYHALNSVCVHMMWGERKGASLDALYRPAVPFEKCDQ